MSRSRRAAILVAVTLGVCGLGKEIGALLLDDPAAAPVGALDSGWASLAGLSSERAVGGQRTDRRAAPDPGARTSTEVPPRATDTADPAPGDLEALRALIARALTSGDPDRLLAALQALQAALPWLGDALSPDERAALATPLLDAALSRTGREDLARLALELLADLDPARFREVLAQVAADPRADPGLLAAALSCLDRVPRELGLELLLAVAGSQERGTTRSRAEEDPSWPARSALAERARAELARRLTPDELTGRLTAPAASADERLLLGKVALEADLIGEAPELDPTTAARLAQQLCEDVRAAQRGEVPEPTGADLAPDPRLPLLLALPPAAREPALLDLLAAPDLNPVTGRRAAQLLAIAPSPGLSGQLVERLRASRPEGNARLALAEGLLAGAVLLGRDDAATGEALLIGLVEAATTPRATAAHRARARALIEGLSDHPRLADEARAALSRVPR